MKQNNVFVDGNGNIVIQDVSNSTITINSTDTSQLENRIEDLNKNLLLELAEQAKKIDGLFDLIKDLIKKQVDKIDEKTQKTRSLIQEYYKTKTDNKRKLEIKNELSELTKINIETINFSEYYEGKRTSVNLTAEKKDSIIERDIKTNINQYILSNQNLLVLTGEAGVGKSTLLSFLYLEKLSQGNKGLFIESKTIELVEQSIDEKRESNLNYQTKTILILRDLFSSKISDNLNFFETLKLINIICIEENKNFILIFDAINEHIEWKKIFDSIFNITTYINKHNLSGIKILTSFRPLTWAEIAIEYDLKKLVKVISLKNYSNTEFQNAAEILNKKHNTKLKLDNNYWIKNPLTLDILYKSSFKETKTFYSPSEIIEKFISDILTRGSISKESISVFSETIALKDKDGYPFLNGRVFNSEASNEINNEQKEKYTEVLNVLIDSNVIIKRKGTKIFYEFDNDKFVEIFLMNYFINDFGKINFKKQPKNIASLGVQIIEYIEKQTEQNKHEIGIFALHKMLIKIISKEECVFISNNQEYKESELFFEIIKTTAKRENIQLNAILKDTIKELIIFKPESFENILESKKIEEILFLLINSITYIVNEEPFIDYFINLSEEDKNKRFKVIEKIYLKSIVVKKTKIRDNALNSLFVLWNNSFNKNIDKRKKEYYQMLSKHLITNSLDKKQKNYSIPKMNIATLMILILSVAVKNKDDNEIKDIINILKLSVCSIWNKYQKIFKILDTKFADLLTNAFLKPIIGEMPNPVNLEELFELMKNDKENQEMLILLQLMKSKDKLSKNKDKLELLLESENSVVYTFLMQLIAYKYDFFIKDQNEKDFIINILTNTCNSRKPSKIYISSLTVFYILVYFGYHNEEEKENVRKLIKIAKTSGDKILEKYAGRFPIERFGKQKNYDANVISTLSTIAYNYGIESNFILKNLNKAKKEENFKLYNYICENMFYQVMLVPPSTNTFEIFNIVLKDLDFVQKKSEPASNENYITPTFDEKQKNTIKTSIINSLLNMKFHRHTAFMALIDKYDSTLIKEINNYDLKHSVGSLLTWYFEEFVTNGLSKYPEKSKILIDIFINGVKTNNVNKGIFVLVDGIINQLKCEDLKEKQ
ncbi:MAG: hypothetical protein JXL97_02800 [Bacteroidales bacterium]|nr:hypothetical protein [Bacteroidales bacterium]